MTSIDLELKRDGLPIDETNRLPVDNVSPDTIDAANTKVITAADASPGSPWVGAASPTRGLGVTGVFLSAFSPGAVVAGSYTFEFGEDGSTWPISIGLHSDDFSTIRFRPLKNVGAFYRAKFEPDAPLGSAVVVLTSQFSYQGNPGFVVPASHVFEESEAAFDAHWSFVKAFDINGDSQNLRALLASGVIAGDEHALLVKAIGTGAGPLGDYVDQRLGGLVPVTMTPAGLLASGGVAVSQVVDTKGYPSILLHIATDQPSAVNGVDIQFSDTEAFAVIRGHLYATVRAADVARGSLTLPFAPPCEFMRVVYTNGTSAQGVFFQQLRLNTGQVEQDTPIQAVPTKGTYGGQNGVSGTVNVPAGAVVRSFACFSGNVTASVTIPGTSGTLALPGSNQQSTTYADNPDPGTMVGPVTFVFSQTAGYAVAWVL